MSSEPTGEHGPSIVSLAGLPPIACPCGVARRAFTDQPDAPASVHLTTITEEAVTHYHRRQTEIYYVLAIDSDTAEIELNGTRRQLTVGDAVLIPPGTRHRAHGRLTILNVVVPPFDPRDEYFD